LLFYGINIRHFKYAPLFKTWVIVSRRKKVSYYLKKTQIF
jgi:hypothetical protein